LARRFLGVIGTAVLAATLAACGGGSSSKPSSVNGCAIQPATSCPNADLSAADLEGVDLTKAESALG
jgi:hypothetical protein